MTTEQATKCKYRTVELVYYSSKGIFTKRKVKVMGVTERHIYGYCYLRKQRRTFQIDRVLAMQPITI